jgi:hypothetical protein
MIKIPKSAAFRGTLLRTKRFKENDVKIDFETGKYKK